MQTPFAQEGLSGACLVDYKHLIFRVGFTCELVASSSRVGREYSRDQSLII